MKLRSVFLIVGLLVSQTSLAIPKIGLVLSGGGARGIAHVGVLKALEELRIPIHYIAGTSMGGVVGGLYASGLSVDALYNATLHEIDWAEVFMADPDRSRLSLREKQQLARHINGLEIGLKGKQFVPSGVLGGEKLFLLLKRYTRGLNVKSFNDLPIPFRCVATDISNAKPYVFDQGDLAVALRTTMSVPFAFSPMRIDNRLLVDGAVLNNLPVDIVRKMGADIVLAVDIGTPFKDIEQDSSFVTIALQSIDTALVQNTLKSLELLGEADLLLKPEIDDITATDFDKAMELIGKGYQSVKQKEILLQGLMRSPKAYQAYQAERAQRVLPTQEQIQLQFIDFAGNERHGKDFLMDKMGAQLGQTVDLQQLESLAEQLILLPDIQQVTYQVTEKQGQTGVEFQIKEKNWGPDYLHIGLNIASDFNDHNQTHLLLRHTRYNLNARGEEWVNEIKMGDDDHYFTELYQPLNQSRHTFIRPHFKLGQAFIDVFGQNNQLATAVYRLRRLQLGLDVGTQLYDSLELHMGPRYLFEDARLRTGDRQLFADGSTHELLFNIGLYYDDLNQQIFPTAGRQAKLDVDLHHHSITSEQDYVKISLDFSHYFEINQELSMQARLFWGQYIDNQPPIYQRFSLGGHDGLAGYPKGAVAGDKSLLLQLNTFWHWPWLQTLSGQIDSRLLFSLHTGNSWAHEQAVLWNDWLLGGRLAVLWDTRFGSLMLGAGYSQSGKMMYSLSLGNDF